MARKIIQIAVSNTLEDDEEKREWLYALCDDGSVWYINAQHMLDDELGGWQSVPAIPQGVNDPKS